MSEENAYTLAELDSEFLNLKEQYTDYGIEYDELLDKIEELEDKKHSIEGKMDNIENKIAQIKKKMHESKIKSVDIQTTDPFTLDFIKASYFTTQDDDRREALQYVVIKENQICAVDGYKAITILNDNIPDELKNTYIMWDVRKDFKDNIRTDNIDYPDISSIYPKEENIQHILTDVTVDNFYNKFIVKKLKETTIVLNYKDFNIGFNPEYLDTALIAMEDENFTVSFVNPVSPMLLESERIKVLVLPKRLLAGWENREIG